MIDTITIILWALALCQLGWHDQIEIDDTMMRSTYATMYI